MCYNAENTISDTLLSVQQQDYPAFEHIIVDGMSTDDTLEKVRSFPSGIIRIISEKDDGLYDALNKGADNAKGDVIVLLHADDTLADRHVLQRMATLFEGNTSLDAVAASVKIFRKGDSKPYRIYDATKFRTWQFRLGMQPPHPGFFVRKEAFRKVGFYRTMYKISGDFDWLLRAIRICNLKVHYTNDVVVHMLDGGISSSGWKNRKLMNRENLRILKNHGIYSNLLLIYLKYIIKIFQIKKL